MWSVSRKRGVRGDGARAGGLIGECESFFWGRYASDLECRGLPVPDWAWLSELAHGPVTALETIAGGDLEMPLPTTSSAHWHAALVLLAREVLNTADRTGCSVEVIQRSVLTDLEFHISIPGPSGGDLDPYRLVEEATTALGQLRDSSHP